jgi:hypothetical protein
LSTKGIEKDLSRCLLSFLIGMEVEKADFRSMRLLSGGGRSPSLLVASSCGNSVSLETPEGAKRLRRLKSHPAETY